MMGSVVRVMRRKMKMNVDCFRMRGAFNCLTWVKRTITRVIQEFKKVSLGVNDQIVVGSEGQDEKSR